MVIYSKDSLEKLRQRIDLVDVLSSHLDLKRTGAAYKALCPFHDERSPSFVVQKGDTHYHCFGCGAHGDAIQFLMNHGKLNFLDAVESLAQRFQVPLVKVEETEKGPNKKALKEACNHACRLFHFLLLHTSEGHGALQYLFSRGIDLDFIRQFKIGLAPKASGILRKVLHEKFVKDEEMVEAGLIVERDGKGYRDFFSDRITFPIEDASGAVIGFSARKYKEETFGGKYVNTPETPLFKKSRVLFGLNHSRRRIAKERKAIVVEGQIDALRLIHEGINIAVAGQGTAFGEGHVKELQALGINLVYLALDPDAAGQEALRKIGHLFQQCGIEVRVPKLPSGHDPDSFLRQFGPEEFLKLLEESGDYISFLVQHQSKVINANTPAGKNELVNTIAKQIRSWEQPVMVHESLKKLAQVTKTPEDMVGVDQNYMPNILIKKSASIGMQSVDSDRIMEADCLRWLLLMSDSVPSLKETALGHLTAEDFRVGICRKVYEAFQVNHALQKSVDLLTLSIEINDGEVQQFINELHLKRINKEKAEQQFVEAVQRILDRNWMEKREEIKRRIQSGHCNDDEALQLAKQFDDLKRKQLKT